MLKFNSKASRGELVRVKVNLFSLKGKIGICLGWCESFKFYRVFVKNAIHYMLRRDFEILNTKK